MKIVKKMKIILKLIIILLMFFVIVTTPKTTVLGANVEPLFAYHYNGTTYESDISYDDAWYIAMKSEQSNGNITMEEIIENYSEFGSRNIIEEEPLTRIGFNKPTLSGKAQWKTLGSDICLPLQRVKVELYYHVYDILSIKIDETYTDENGDYFFDDYELWQINLSSLGYTIVSNQSQKFSVKIYPEGRTFKVGRDWLCASFDDYMDGLLYDAVNECFEYFITSSIKTCLWESTSNFKTIIIPYDPENDTNKSFYISQALVMAERFAIDVCDIQINKKVTALYPFTQLSESFCYDIFMAICTKGGDKFDHWNVIIHEYGHFLQRILDINSITLADYAYYNPTHYSKHNHMAPKCKDGKGDKRYGAELAWTEAWATTYSLITIDYYLTGYYGDPAKTLADYKIANYDYNLNNYNNYVQNIVNYNSNDKNNMCEGQEDAIILFMWELYNQNYYGLEGFLKTAINAKTYMFSTYIKSIYDEYSLYINNITSIMSKYQLAPGNLEILNYDEVNYFNAPQISWKINGSSSNPLRCVKLQFYTNTGNKIYDLEINTGSATHNDTFVYNVPIDEWKYVLNLLNGEKLYLVVAGNDGKEFITGPYYSNVIDMDINFPTFLYVLNSNGFSYSLVDIWNEDELVNCSIEESYRGFPVTMVSSSAFKDSINMETVFIPETITFIGSKAFENCINLETVTIAQSHNTLITLGEEVFLECPLLEKIIVPGNKIFKYKNHADWNLYKQLIVSNDFQYDEVNLHCYSEILKQDNVNEADNSIYKLNIDCSKNYKFILSAEMPIEFELYDNNMDEVTIEIVMNNNECNITSNKYLSKGTYYITTCFQSILDDGLINISITPTYSTDAYSVDNGSNQILTHLHQESDKYNNHLKFSAVNSGYYDISLNYESIEEEFVMPQGCISIYDSSLKTDLVLRLSTEFEKIRAYSGINCDNVIVYLVKGETYYIDVTLPNNSFESLTLNVDIIDDVEIVSLFNYSESTNEKIIINHKTGGDFLSKLIIKQKAKYKISYQYDGPQADDIYFVFYKYEFNSNTYEENIELVFPDMMVGARESFTIETTLNSGIYYIGYYNKENLSSIKIAIEYIVNEYNTNSIISDPDAMTLCGSMINIYEKNSNNKSYRSKTIVTGFTRVLYFDPILEVESRTDFDWYSSDDDIASVSQIGTILGKSEGPVKIMAVKKSDARIVYVETFYIISDPNPNSNEIINVIEDSHYASYGIYTLTLNVQNCPYPSFYLYQWNIISSDDTITYVELDGHGNFIFEGYGNIVIKGSEYYYNEKYSVIVNLYFYN